MKTIKTAVRILMGDATMTTAEPIRDPRFGLMLPGPEYDRYRKLADYHDNLQALVSAMESLSLTKDAALQRIAELQAGPAAITDIETGLSMLQAGLSGQGGDMSKALENIRHGLRPLDMGVYSLAYAVPKPADPNAPKPVQGQRLGTGLRDAWA